MQQPLIGNESQSFNAYTGASTTDSFTAQQLPCFGTIRRIIGFVRFTMFSYKRKLCNCLQNNYLYDFLSHNGYGLVVCDLCFFLSSVSLSETAKFPTQVADIQANVKSLLIVCQSVEK
jgi:hypothetical protein